MAFGLVLRRLKAWILVALSCLVERHGSGRKTSIKTRMKIPINTVGTMMSTRTERVMISGLDITKSPDPGARDPLLPL